MVKDLELFVNQKMDDCSKASKIVVSKLCMKKFHRILKKKLHLVFK